MNQKTCFEEPSYYGFSPDGFNYDPKSPHELFGRHICCLSQKEKQILPIEKLLKRISHPSAEELKNLGADFMVCVESGSCRFVTLDGRCVFAKVFNLGTKQTPAFFYSKYIFVLDKTQKAFKAIDLKIVYFNKNYVLMWVGNDLLVKYDIKGLSLMGKLKSFYLLEKSSRPAYVLEVIDAKGNEVIYGLGADVVKLFELLEGETFEIYDDSVLLKDENNSLKEIFAFKGKNFVCL